MMGPDAYWVFGGVIVAVVVVVCTKIRLNEMHKVINFICCVESVRLGVLWSLAIIKSHLLLHGWGSKARKPATYPRHPLPKMPSQQRPVCIVTGASSGLGAAAAHALAKEGFFVVVAGNSLPDLLKTMADIRTRVEDSQIEAFEVDLSSFTSIMKFKNKFQRWLFDKNLHPSIQLLINNAGILATSYRATDDGFEEMMMTNYMGAFCLSKVLLPLLSDSPVPSRIVNVSSFTHRNVYELQVDKEFISGKSFQNLKQYPFGSVYENSKLCLLLYSYEMHRQIGMEKASQLSINVADPGFVKTNIMHETPSYFAELAFFVFKTLGLLHDPEEGVNSILDAALAPPETSGIYFFGGKGRTLDTSSLSNNAELAERLWKTSSSLFLELKLVYEKTANLEYTSDKL